MAAIPSGSLFMATHDYYWPCLASTSSNSSHGSPHHPSLPKKLTLLFMAMVLESPECLDSPQASSGMITCDLTLQATRKQCGGQPGKANTGPQS
ncbi:unnamed protein product [Nyctereutes procyonoides]|uniref:(raccoon dog) hypothetical protein n=1 Tax=Nyctereutes procyonoides TaxID=34880 RepID=A0A811ZQG8_NYCPR|nr:unnamed protein product [Nyctereutes procyonoides]